MTKVTFRYRDGSIDYEYLQGPIPSHFLMAWFQMSGHRIVEIEVS